MKCSTILLISINILFLIISVLVVASGSVLQYLYGDYYYMVQRHVEVWLFPALWIAAGCFLLVVSIFGILVSSVQNTILINTYTVLLSMVLLLHVATAVTALLLGVCRSTHIAAESLQSFIDSYEYDPLLRKTMDWTQHKYACCGNKGPDDWVNYNKGKRKEDTLTTTTPSENSTTTSTTQAIETVNAMPVSCCVRDTDYINFRCENHYTNGCSSFVQDVFSTNVMIASFLAMGMALLDLLGAVATFLISKSLRRVPEVKEDYSPLAMKRNKRDYSQFALKSSYY